jgi:hypothetical protein
MFSTSIGSLEVPVAALDILKKNLISVENKNISFTAWCMQMRT